jgi:hypothetical protein
MDGKKQAGARNAHITVKVARAERDVSLSFFAPNMRLG